MAQMGLGDQVDQRQAQEEKLLNEVLRNERNNIEISRKQRGKKLKSRPTRSTLLALQHQALSEQVSVQSTDRLIVIAREYPPSDRAFADLKLIMLNDLLMETVHNDNYVVLRTISPALRRAALFVVVEDARGTADFLHLYNINVGLDDESFLPLGTFLAIRAPYYKRSTRGVYALRADHPSDVVQMDNFHPIVMNFHRQSLPACLQYIPTIKVDDGPGNEQDLMILKEEGSKLFQSQKYDAAFQKYSTAIRSPALEAGSELSGKLYCNRAIARLRLSQFDGAIQDCEEVLEVAPNNSKAIFLKARALYRLRSFRNAQTLCQGLLAIEPTSRDARVLFESATERVLESNSGKFNFQEMELKAKEHEYPRLDYGDYVGPVEIRHCNPSSKGRGLFATRDIDQGDLVICEKAFMFGYGGERKRPLAITLHMEKKRYLKGPDAYLPSETMQLLNDNPSLADQFLSLYSGDQYTSVQPLQVTAEGTPVISAFTVFGIWDYNSFRAQSVMKMVLPESVEDAMAVLGSADASTGLWVQSSYINHSCIGNVDRAFIGDFMIVRASRSIKAGEELLFSYTAPLGSVEERSQELQRFGFTCTCVLSTRQRSIPATECQAHNGVKLAAQYTVLFTELYTAGKKQDCVSALREGLTLVSGADAKSLATFKPLLFCAELMPFLFALCILLEEVGERQEAQTARDMATTFWGIFSGVGQDNVVIEGILRKYKSRFLLGQMMSPVGS